MLAALTLLALVCAGRLCAAEPPTAPPADRFPEGTNLVLYDTAHGRTYFATDEAVYRRRSDERFLLPEKNLLEAMQVSADGRALLLRLYYGSLVLDAADLHLVRRLDTPIAWWEGSRPGYIRWDDEDRPYLFTGGRESKARVGRTMLYAADSKGRYFLGGRQINRNYLQEVQLWRRTEEGKLRLARTLTTDLIDPGSTGLPRYLETNASGRVVVFGLPWGGDIGEDFVNVAQGRRVTLKLHDSRGRPLLFARRPLMVNDAIVALVVPDSADPNHPGPTDERLLLTVTERKITVEPLSSDVVFVTYHPQRRAIGLGLADAEGVSVEWRADR